MQQIRRRRRNAKAWREVFARFSKSGLSVADFCRGEDIGEVSFCRWRSRLGGGTVTRTALAKPATRLSPAFVDLGSLNTASRRLEMRLDLGEGLVLHLVRS